MEIAGGVVRAVRVFVAADHPRRWRHHSATRGLTTEDIAKQFDISVSCVLKHFTSIFRKLDVTNRTEAITVALRKQLLKV